MHVLKRVGSSRIFLLLALVLTLGAMAFGGAALAPSAVAISVSPSSAAKPCSARYVHAVLPWGHKCLAAGQFCKRDGDRYYHRYRFHCHGPTDSRGNYHLRR